MWDKLRFPDGREYGGPGSGVYRTTDGGETWTRRKRFSSVSPLEIAPGAPDTVYFGSNSLNRSDDRGVTWRAVSPDLTGGPTPPQRHVVRNDHHDRHRANGQGDRVRHTLFAATFGRSILMATIGDV